MPSAPTPQSRTGRPPAGEASSRRTAATSRVGASAISQSTIRIEVAEVDHGSDTATAAASASAIWPRRGACRPVDTRSDLRSGPDMLVMFVVAPAEPGGCVELRQSALRARASAVQDGIEPCVVGGQARTIRARVPQVDDAGGEASILATQPAAQQANEQVGILPAPAVEAGIEAVDALEVGAPDRKIAGARAAPPPRLEPAQRSEREPQHAHQSIDVAAQAF